ncbi:MAG: oxidoreductase [Segetibacter sp.]|jgi:photosystem II stability/assembly factor-like uncharacterized protein|nr:oxidoreductase [Segetibacter sp.]
MKLRFLLSVFIFLLTTSYAQKKLNVQILTAGTNTSLRGMSVPTKTVIWVSGSNGTIGKSTDGGKTWRWLIVSGYEKRDFRDIEAFDSSTAIIMAVDNPAYILKTTDGGATWRKVFEKDVKGMFLDAMDFKNDTEGICVGDPLAIGTDKRFFYVIRTYDGGNSWLETPAPQLTPAANGEAIFSASGTNISFLNHPDFEYAFVTGGMVSNLIMIGRDRIPNKAVNIPVVQKKESAGTFSMATDGHKKFYCIGGDYKIPTNDKDNFHFSLNNGNQWKAPVKKQPTGYRSCIRIIKNKTMVACGTSGIDFAKNGEKEWRKISPESFNVCMISPNGKVYLAGEKGKIGILTY